MKKFIVAPIILMLTIFLLSCNSEDSKIKEALKSAIPTEMVKNYEYKSHQIVETILDSNIKDSISALESANTVKIMLLEEKDKKKEYYLAQIAQMKRQQQTTLPWLRGDYRGIIRDWQRMLDDVNREMKQDSLVMDSLNKRIDYFNGCIEGADSPIIFYKVKHEYMLSGAYHCDEVVLDSRYQLVKQ